MWYIIDDMSAELLKRQASSSNRRRFTDLLVRGAKPFTQWIDGAPKEKWSLLYDTNGRRYGIEKWSLIGIVEFIMYGCVRYFRERYASAASLLHDPGVRFCERVNEYMEKKDGKSSISLSYIDGHKRAKV